MLDIRHSFKRYGLSVSIKPLNEEFRAKFHEYYHFCIIVDLGNLKIKLEKFVGLKMVVFSMKYEHQINWANTYDDTKLDISSSGLAWNSSLYSLSTVQSLLSRNG